MAEKKNKNPLGIPETRGKFKISGTVFGVESERFYNEKNTRNDKPRRSVNFGVQYDKEQSCFINMAGMEQKSVYYSKRTKDASGKDVNNTVEVPWAERMTFAQEGYSMIGTKIGLEQTVDANGSVKNVNKIFTPWDACEYVHNHLKDDMPVFIYGDISYSKYNDVTRKSFEPAQMYREKSAPDFDADDFEAVGAFQQKLVYMGIRKESNERAVVSAKIVTRTTIEDAEFVVEHPGLARTLHKHVKPYTCFEAVGYIREVKNETSEEKSTSNLSNLDWGDVNPMDTKRESTHIELVITRVLENTIDTEVYKEEAMEKAMLAAKSLKNAKKDFGEKDDEAASDWGKGSAINDDDEEEDGDW